MKYLEITTCKPLRAGWLNWQTITKVFGIGFLVGVLLAMYIATTI